MRCRFQSRCFVFSSLRFASSVVISGKEGLDPFLLNNSEKELLHVEVVGARELYHGRFDLLNPFVRVCIGTTTYRTGTQKRTSDPIFGSVFVFDYASDRDIFMAEVWDDEFIGDKLIGVAFTTVGEIRKGQIEAEKRGQKDFETFFQLLPDGRLMDKEIESKDITPWDGSTTPLSPTSPPEPVQAWEKSPKRKVTDDTKQQQTLSSWQRDSTLWIQNVLDSTRKAGRNTTMGIWSTFMKESVKDNDKTAVVEETQPQTLGIEETEKLQKAKEEMVFQGRLYLKFRLAKAKDLVHVLPAVVPPAKILPSKIRQQTLKETWTSNDKQGLKKRRFRILALDGGGIRGVLSAGILRRLTKEKRFPTLLDDVDLICGTSTGGILTMLFACGYSAAQAQSLYAYHSPKIFASIPTRKYSPFVSKYTNTYLEEMMKQHFEDLVLSELPRPVMVTAFKIRSEDSEGRERGWRPVLFSNIAQFHDDDVDASQIRCSDVAVRISAAPTFFPAYQDYVDGALFANNPVLCAMARVSNVSGRVDDSYCNGIDINDVSVLSIGSGSFDFSIPRESEDEKSLDWGIRQWAPYLRDILFDSAALSLDQNLSLMLGDRYARVNPKLKGDFAVGLDDVDSINDLIKLSSTVDLTEAEAFIKKIFYDQQNDSQK